MKVCGFEIDAVVDEHGRLKMRNEGKRGIKKKIALKSPQRRFEILRNDTLKNLCKLNEFLNYHRFDTRKHSFSVLLEVVSKFLGKPPKVVFGKKTNWYNHTQEVYNYAYAIVYLKLYG